jgi:hypothetical protein
MAAAKRRQAGGKGAGKGFARVTVAPERNVEFQVLGPLEARDD